MQDHDHTRAGRLAEWANRIAREIVLNPDPRRRQALDQTYDDVATLLRIEIQKAHPEADGFDLFWLTADAIFPGIIERANRAARRAVKRKHGASSSG